MALAHALLAILFVVSLPGLSDAVGAVLPSSAVLPSQKEPIYLAVGEGEVQAFNGSAASQGGFNISAIGINAHIPFRYIYNKDLSYAPLMVQRWEEDGSFTYFNEGDYTRMGTVFKCGDKWYYSNIYYKSGFFGPNAFRQDRNLDRGNLQLRIGKLGGGHWGQSLPKEDAIALVTYEQSSACSYVGSWDPAGEVWNMLADAFNGIVEMVFGDYDNFAFGPEKSEDDVGGSLPCDPVSPAWLEMAPYMVDLLDGGYAPLYKLTAQRFYWGGGSGDVKQLVAKCSGDGLKYYTWFNDPTYVVFW